jgi:hypothetical protein
MEQSRRIVDTCRQSIIEVEKLLYEMKQTVSAWPPLSGEEFEPERGLMIEHLEDMLSCLDGVCDDDGSQTGSVLSREDDVHTADNLSDNEVCN